MARRSHFHASAAFSLEKELQLPIEQEPGWAPGLLWAFWRREESLAPDGDQIPDRPALSLAYPFI
jgi:hypothetical protein